MNKRIAQISFLLLAVMAASVVGGEASARSLAAPTISSISPTTGGRGTAVTITGANFQDAVVTWRVASKSGNSSSASDTITSTVSPDGTSIMFSVPDGGPTSNGIMAASGANRVTVTTPEGSVSKLFSVTTTNKLGLRPAVTYLMPLHAAQGAQITIFGTHLTTTTAVKLDGMKAKFRVPSDTRIVATVPLKAHTGHWTVTTQYGTAMSPSFKVSGAAT